MKQEPEQQPSVSVQQADFNVADEYLALTADSGQAGAAVFFVGLVRDFNQGHSVLGLELEHYPGMTEKVITNILEQAQQRWPIERSRVIHRVGKLNLSEQIVFVGVTSTHREAAYQASQFIMDQLKTQAPFWKKERTDKSERWVEAEDKDVVAQQRWDKVN